MPQVVLDRAQVMSLVSQRVATGMAEHVGVDLVKIGSLTDTPGQVVNALTSELPASFGNEQPRQSGIANPQVMPDRPQLVAFERMMRRETSLESVDPDPRGLQIQGGDAQSAQFGFPQPVPKHQQHH